MEEIEITAYSSLNYHDKWIVDDLINKIRTPIEIDWWQVSNGDVRHLNCIA